MIHALLAALTWLDRRFPPRVTVTKEAYEAMIEREHQRAKGATTLRLDLDTTKDRIKNLETAVAGIKDLLAKGGSSPAPEKRRADFIASGRMAE